MTRQEHFEMYKEHNKKAREALHAFIANTSDRTKWDEYKAESKIANRHLGVSNAMFTKEMKKYK